MCLAEFNLKESVVEYIFPLCSCYVNVIITLMYYIATYCHPYAANV